MKGSMKEPNKLHNYETEIIIRKASDAAEYNWEISKKIEWLHERTEHLDIFLYAHPSMVFPMFCLLVEGECQILVFLNIIS